MITAERLLHRLDLRVVRRLDGLHPGDHRTFLNGPGVDFADLREYQVDDDVRHIDWNVTARMDAPFVRQYVADRELSAWLLVDRSASMRFGADGYREATGDDRRDKAAAVADFVTVMARLLTLRGNRVGLALFDHGFEQLLEPHGGRTQVLRIAHELLRVRPTEPATHPARPRWWRRGAPAVATDAVAPGHTDLAGALASAAKSIRRRSLIIVLSDFISESAWERPLGALARRHEVICVRFIAPAESELVPAGVQVVQDLESGEQLTVDTSDPGLRKRFAELAATRQEDIRRTVARAGVDLHRVGTDEDLVGALVRLIERRQR